ncbi:MAG: DUF3592 domain-containing protein [Terracidiphilus sp.]
MILIEIWERLRGYDKWIQTEATVKGSRVSSYSGQGCRSENVLSWNDAFGKTHRVRYFVWDDSPLFQLYEGQTIALRYNPKKPSRFFCRALFHARMYRAIKMTFLLIFLLSLLVLSSWLKVRWRK